MEMRVFLKTLVMVAAAATVPSSWASQQFPTKPVTVMVPYPPGGLSDVIARMVTPRMSAELGQPVIVENLGGASGGLGIQKVLRAPNDGYYVLVGSPNELVLAPLAISSLKFRSEDFRMIQEIGDLTMTIKGRPDLPASNADELVAYAAKRAREGKPLSYGSVGNGSLYHLLGERMSKLIGIPMTHVPYKGGAPMTQDLMGGMIDINIGPSGANNISLAKQGKMKLIATLTPERISAFHNVPSVRESKTLRDFVYAVPMGLFVRKDTPGPIIEKLQKAASAALSDPSITPLLESQSIVPAKRFTLLDAEKNYQASTEQYRAIAKSIGLKPE